MIQIIAKPNTMSMDNYANMMRLADHWRVKNILMQQKMERSLFRSGFNRGAYTEDKEMFRMGRIPAFLKRTKWYRERFPSNLPPEELYKRREEFFKANPALRSSDYKL